MSKDLKLCSEKYRILMVHEVTPAILKLDLSGFDIITFDDGLYSQYFHREHFLKLNKPLYYFISTDIVHTNNDQITDISCSTAHKEYGSLGKTNAYMTWSQIKDLSETKLCHIGGHSHTHPRLKSFKLNLLLEKTRNELDSMMAIFRQEGIEIDSFCYPYNQEVFTYKLLLKEKGVTSLIGKGRIPVESLIN